MGSKVGEIDGIPVGMEDGIADGVNVLGTPVGIKVGNNDGVADGVTVGKILGFEDGFAVGIKVKVGKVVGRNEGADVGEVDGITVESKEVSPEGSDVPFIVGLVT